MYIKRLAENLVQKALLLIEILSFEVYCRSDRLPVSLSRGADLIYNKLQNLISQKVIKLFEPNFQ